MPKDTRVVFLEHLEIIRALNSWPTATATLQAFHTTFAAITKLLSVAAKDTANKWNKKNLHGGVGKLKGLERQANGKMNSNN